MGLEILPGAVIRALIARTIRDLFLHESLRKTELDGIPKRS